MLKRFLVLFVLCLTVLPSCKHNIFDTGPEGVEFKYGPGNRKLHMAMSMKMLKDGKQLGPEMAMASCDIFFSVRKVESRLAWEITLDQLEIFNTLKKGVFYNVTFTSDIKGNDKRDIVIADSEVEDSLKLGKSMINNVTMPDGFFRKGDLSLKVFNEKPDAGGFEIVLPDPEVKYIYDGIKVVDGEELYTFSRTIEGVVYRQGGKELTGSIVAKVVSTKNMLPVSEDVVMTMVDPDGMTIIIKAKSGIKSDKEDKAAGAGGSSSEFLAKLEKAPLRPVTTPMEFYYTPTSSALLVEATVTIAKGDKPGTALPLLEYRLDVDISDEDKRLNWQVDMSDIKAMGSVVGDGRPIKMSFTSDKRCNNVQDFHSESGEIALTQEDIAKDFLLPEGLFRSGDVVLPPFFEKKVDVEFIAPEGAGYVFEGMKTVDSMEVVVFSADVEGIRMIHKKSGKTFVGSLQSSRYYDASTMLMLHQNTIMTVDMKDKGTMVTNATIIRAD